MVTIPLLWLGYFPFVFFYINNVIIVFNFFVIVIRGKPLTSVLNAPYSIAYQSLDEPFAFFGSQVCPFFPLCLVGSVGLEPTTKGL